MECTMFDPNSHERNHHCFYEYYYTDDDFSYYNFFNKVLLSFLLFNSALLLSCWLTGTFVAKEITEEKKEEKYEEKYPIDMMNELLKSKTEVSKNTVLMENTPEGNVMMRYNLDREGFEYWCDNKNIKYDYLETVARKFVITNFCIELYKDRFKSIENQKKEKEEQQKKEEEEEEIEENDIDKKIEEELETESSDDDVFVKPKKVINTGKEKENKKEEEIVAQEANKYLYMGRIKEFAWVIKPKVENKVKKMSYADWFSSM